MVRIKKQENIPLSKVIHVRIILSPNKFHTCSSSQTNFTPVHPVKQISHLFIQSPELNLQWTLT